MVSEHINHAQQTYAGALQRGMGQTKQHWMPAGPQQPAPERFTQQPFPTPQPQQPTHQASPPSFAPVAGPSRQQTRTYAEVLRAAPVTEQELPSYPNPFDSFDGGYEHGSDQGFFDDKRKRLLPTDVTSNPNYYSGVNEPADAVRLSQLRTPRGRMLPRLDTNRLSPFPSSAHRSPASITSPSSSRLSSRRTKHEMRHGISKYRCPACHSGFDTKPDLKHHLRSHTPEEQRPHKCDTCGKRFWYPKDVTRHSVVHLPNDFFCPVPSCKHSAKGFSRQDHLDRHIRTKHAADSVLQSSQPSSLPDM